MSCVKYFSEVVEEMHRLLGRKKAFSSKDRFIQSKAVAKKPLESCSQSCISSSESVANCHSSCGNLVEERGSTKEYTASNHSKNLVAGDNCTMVKNDLPCRTSDSGTASSVVEEGDCEVHPKTMDSDQSSRSKVFFGQEKTVTIDIIRIRETLKRRKSDGVVKKSVEAIIAAEVDGEAWIESELENGIEMGNEASMKKQKVV